MDDDLSQFSVKEVTEEELRLKVTKETVIDFTNYPTVIIGQKPTFFVIKQISSPKLVEIAQTARYIISPGKAPVGVDVRNAEICEAAEKIPDDLKPDLKVAYSAICALGRSAQQEVQVPREISLHKKQRDEERETDDERAKFSRKASETAAAEFTADELAGLRRRFGRKKFIVFYNTEIIDVVEQLETANIFTIVQTPCGVAACLDGVLTTDELAELGGKMQVFK